MGECKAKAIQTNLSTFKHNQTYPGIIQAYSEPRVTPKMSFLEYPGKISQELLAQAP